MTIVRFRRVPGNGYRCVGQGDQPGDLSGEYVPAAEAQALVSRVEALETALRGLISWCEAVDMDGSIFVVNAIVKALDTLASEPPS